MSMIAQILINVDDRMQADVCQWERGLSEMDFATSGKKRLDTSRIRTCALNVQVSCLALPISRFLVCPSKGKLISCLLPNHSVMVSWV